MRCMNWRKPPEKDPNDGLPKEWVDRALTVADPRLAAFLGTDPADMDPVAREEGRFMMDAARVKVRRIVAALNGTDVEAQVSTGTSLKDAPALVSRMLLHGVKAALLTDSVAAAMEKAIGEDAAAELLGELAAL